MIPELTDYEKHQLFEIEKWMQREPDAISKLADGMLAPFTRLISMVIPQSAIAGALNLGNSAGETLCRLQTIRQFAGIKSFEELRSGNLELCDRLAQGEQNWAMGVAAVEGAATGLAGLPGLAVDIPAIIAQAMRSIHLMGLCYGFELKTPQDRDIAIGILSASGANSMKEKIAALVYLRTVQTTLAKESFRAMATKATQSAFSQQAVILGAKAIAKQLGVNLSKRKLAQSIPVLGAGIGACVNAWYISDVCWAARRTFQERWLREKGVLDSEIGSLPVDADVIDVELLSLRSPENAHTELSHH
jgi:hypothetical protein